MREGDLILFYHSSCEIPGIAGIAKVASKSYPDETQFDSKSEYFDPKASQENPRWYLVDVAFHKDLSRFIPLEELKQQKELTQMKLLQRGNRLSILPVSPEEFKIILSLGT